MANLNDFDTETLLKPDFWLKPLETKNKDDRDAIAHSLLLSTVLTGACMELLTGMKDGDSTAATEALNTVYETVSRLLPRIARVIETSMGHKDTAAPVLRGLYEAAKTASMEHPHIKMCAMQATKHEATPEEFHALSKEIDELIEMHKKTNAPVPPKSKLN